jgi:YesN/AraC family two-component response regulator
LELLQNILSTEYDIITATNGQEAYELLHAHGTEVQIVITDIMMPLMDGYSFLNSARNHPQLGFIPFLFLSALSSDEAMLKAYRLGVDGYLTKPFETIDLKVRVRNLIRNQLLRREYLERPKQAIGNGELSPNLPSMIAGPDKALSYNGAWLQELETIVKENITHLDFKVTDIALQMNVSERTLRNRIKTYTGLTPTVYVQRIRLELAVLYLRESRYKTVSELSYAVGFKADRHFSKLFKEEFGKLPSEHMK